MTHDQWINEVSEGYAGVAAGVEINQRCSILTAAESEKLEKDLDNFTRCLAGKIHPEFLALTRQTSKELAADEPYNLCGQDARQAVIEAQELVTWWLNQLNSCAV